MLTLEKNFEMNIHNISQFTSTPDNGITRLPFTLEANKVCDYLRFLMEGMGLSVHQDNSGSIFGVLKGSNPNAGSIIIGSHYDSVINGGKFDGIAGIIAGIEVVRLIQESGIRLNHSIEIMATNDEEGIRFGTGFFGAKAMLGEIDHQYLEVHKDENNISIYTAMKLAHLNPDDIQSSKRDIKKLKAFLEIHIEQGPILDKNQVSLGIVDGIVGMKRYLLSIIGRPDHAGTTPMHMRVDAMTYASKIIAKISELAECQNTPTVATVGFINMKPNAINTIPQEVQFSLDIRSIDSQCMDTILASITRDLEKYKSECGIDYHMAETLNVLPVQLSEKINDLFIRKCIEKSYSFKRMLSGAGHDCLVIAPHIPTGLIFVPSKNGRSHCSEEFSQTSDFIKAIEVVKSTIIELDTEEN